MSGSIDEKPSIRHVALIKRVRNGETYYVFPGGGIEEGETISQAARREAFEELGVTVAVKELLVEVAYNGTQYFFKAEINGGTFGTGEGEEFKGGRGSYLPVWIAIEKLDLIDVRPEEVALKLQSLY
ncbi:NUDIX domain-containing protein [Thalassobacillus hwangdonensis]|uniref:NUDIX domain-containing protein n=1 Tax=Thalassobacillus hwangdonensis TaxID=546108 RepID=A0ABW3L8C9_9BACI